MTGCVLNMTVFILNITEFILQRTGLILKGTGSVLKIPQFYDDNDYESNGMSYITVLTVSRYQKSAIKNLS